MPRKYKNSDASKDYNRRLFDALVHLQDTAGITNAQLCDLSETGFVSTQLARNTGVKRENYRGEKKYFGQRDMTDIVTFFDLCRGINPKDPESVALRCVLMAWGFDPQQIQDVLKMPRRPYAFHYDAVK